MTTARPKTTPRRTFQVRLTEAEYEAVIQVAVAEGHTFSAWARWRLMQAVKAATAPPPALPPKKS